MSKQPLLHEVLSNQWARLAQLLNTAQLLNHSSLGTVVMRTGTQAKLQQLINVTMALQQTGTARPHTCLDPLGLETAFGDQTTDSYQCSCNDFLTQYTIITCLELWFGLVVSASKIRSRSGCPKQ
jgi:hypothetical protein